MRDHHTVAKGRWPTAAEVLSAMSEIGNMPKARWLLIAPDGRVWAEEKPAAIVRTLLAYVPLDALLETGGTHA